MTAAVCRASAGAVEHLPVAVVPNLARYLKEIKRGDLWIYAAAADAEQSMWEADLSGGLALVFGAEGKGVRPLVRRACDGEISIPLAGQVESLNVSVAAALLLYEAAAAALTEVTGSAGTPRREHMFLAEPVLCKRLVTCGFACYVLPQLQGES